MLIENQDLVVFSQIMKVSFQRTKRKEFYTHYKLPFLGSTSFKIRKKLQKLFNDKLTSCNLKIVFTPPVRVKRFFTLKDKLPKTLLSGLAYKYKCGGCNATYWGRSCDISNFIGRDQKVAPYHLVPF